MIIFQSACPEGSFGRDCLEECGRCVNNTCDHVNGSCIGPCQDGWEGGRCLLAKGKSQYTFNPVCVERLYFKNWEVGVMGTGGIWFYSFFIVTNILKIF